MANLRILYNNVATSVTSITATTSAPNFLASSLLKEAKGLVWRSTTTTAVITLNWTSAQNISCVILPFNNLTNSATVRVKLFTGVGGATAGPDSGVLSAIVGTFETWGNTYSGVNRYSYGKAGCTTVWMPYTTAVTKIEVTITDSGNTDGYIEVSSILAGAYWSPVRNTSFGVDLGVTDLSENTRTQSGNLVTNVGPSFRTMKFNLDYMPVADRNTLIQVLRLNGVRTPIFVSLFPTDSNETISLYQIYGKLTNLASITHPIFSMYTSSIDIEEV